MSRLPAPRWPGICPTRARRSPEPGVPQSSAGRWKPSPVSLEPTPPSKLRQLVSSLASRGGRACAFCGAGSARSCEALAHGLCGAPARRCKRASAPRREQSARQPWFQWLAPRAAGRRCLTEGVGLLDSRNAESCGISRSSAVFGAPLGSTVAAFVNCSAAPWCRVGGARGSRMKPSPARCKRVRDAFAGAPSEQNARHAARLQRRSDMRRIPGAGEVVRGARRSFRTHPPLDVRAWHGPCSFVHPRHGRLRGWLVNEEMTR